MSGNFGWSVPAGVSEISGSIGGTVSSTTRTVSKPKFWIYLAIILMIGVPILLYMVSNVINFLLIGIGVLFMFSATKLKIQFNNRFIGFTIGVLLLFIGLLFRI